MSEQPQTDYNLDKFITMSVSNDRKIYTSIMNISDKLDTAQRSRVDESRIVIDQLKPLKESLEFQQNKIDDLLLDYHKTAKSITEDVQTWIDASANGLDRKMESKFIQPLIEIRDNATRLNQLMTTRMSELSVNMTKAYRSIAQEYAAKQDAANKLLIASLRQQIDSLANKDRSRWLSIIVYILLSIVFVILAHASL